MLKIIYFQITVLLSTCIFLVTCTTSQTPPTPVILDSLAIIFPDTITLDLTNMYVIDSIFGKSQRFGAEAIFPDSEIETHSSTFGHATDLSGANIQLDFTFVAPKSDTLKKRPFILFVHEGSFLFGTKENELEKAKSMARRGYACATINYRLGIKGASKGYICNSNSNEIIKSIYRAVQDTYSALFYFTQNADALGINTSQVFLAGSSAGAITISTLAYVTENDFIKLDSKIVTSLGKLDPYQTSKRYKLRGLLTSLGYGFLQEGSFSKITAQPTIFFQRSKDNVLPFDKGPLFLCDNYPASLGSKGTSDLLKSFNTPYELNYEPEVGHLTTYPDYYITEHYALFIKRIWNKDYRQIVSERYKVIEDKEIN